VCKCTCLLFHIDDQTIIWMLVYCNGEALHLSMYIQLNMTDKIRVIKWVSNLPHGIGTLDIKKKLLM
jgi:hypothetical protein